MIDSISREAENMIKPRGCVKPNIKIGKWVFTWNDVSYGIPKEQVQEFKEFLMESLIILQERYKEIKKSIKRDEREKIKYDERGNIKNKRMMSERLITIVKEEFELRMAWDNIIFVDYNKDLYVPHNTTNGYYHAQMILNWNLGELEYKGN